MRVISSLGGWNSSNTVIEDGGVEERGGREKEGGRGAEGGRGSRENGGEELFLLDS